MKWIIFFYLTSFGTSLLGNSITAIALPLVVLFTTGSPSSAGVVAIAAAVPAALAGILVSAFEPVTVLWITSGLATVAALITRSPPQNGPRGPCSTALGSSFGRHCCAD